MTRIALLLLSVLSATAVACGSADDDGERPVTPTHTNGATDDAVFRLTVTIDGAPMPENHSGVGARVNGHNCGSSLFVDGAWEIHVAADEGKSGCGTPGAIVTFVLLGAGDPGGTEADQSGVWDNTQLNKMAINFNTKAP